MATVQLAGSTWEVVGAFGMTTLLAAQASITKNGAGPLTVTTAVNHSMNRISAEFWETASNQILGALYEQLGGGAYDPLATYAYTLRHPDGVTAVPTSGSIT